MSYSRQLWVAKFNAVEVQARYGSGPPPEQVPRKVTEIPRGIIPAKMVERVDRQTLGRLSDCKRRRTLPPFEEARFTRNGNLCLCQHIPSLRTFSKAHLRTINLLAYSRT